MQLLTYNETSLTSGALQEDNFQNSTVHDLVPEFVAHYQKVWWACRSDLPEFPHLYARSEQTGNEKQLDGMVNGLLHEMKYLPSSKAELEKWQDRVYPAANRFMQSIFHLTPQQLEFIESSGLVDAIRTFIKMAREFDPAISSEDIYQAGRNVTTANLIQLLLGLPVRVSPSIFAYSMLYPYTDNYLDDRTIADSTKRAFNLRFRRRLSGEDVEPPNLHETKINNLIAMIESEWDRTLYPQVYASLLSIHRAQTHSLDLVAPGISPFERDILGISFEKGGTSVMTDGFLVGGSLTLDQARILFGFGAFTQLMDDLEDIEADRRDNRASLFSSTAPYWKLDDLNNRFIHFGHSVISDLDAFTGDGVPLLSEIMSIFVDPMLLSTAAQADRFFSKEYLTKLETHLPFRFSELNRQRSRLVREKSVLARQLEKVLLFSISS